MKYGKIKGIDKKISRIVMGSMIITTDKKEESFALLDQAVESGITAIDTAHGYAGGNSERCIGDWMKARNNREQVTILSKGCHHSGDRKRVTPYDLGSDLLDTLARLKSDYVDIYVLHRDNPAVPVGEMVDAFNEHYQAGRVKAFGGSNWTHQRLAEANEYAAKHSLVPFTASSPNYGLAEQVDNPWGEGCVGLSGPQNAEARKWYGENGIAIFAYSSLGRGFFSGRLNRQNYREVADNACQTAYCHEVNFKRLDRVAELAEKEGFTIPQLALAYILNQGLDVYALVGAASEAELKANNEACDIQLTPEECAWLDLR